MSYARNRIEDGKLDGIPAVKQVEKSVFDPTSSGHKGLDLAAHLATEVALIELNTETAAARLRNPLGWRAIVPAEVASEDVHGGTGPTVAPTDDLYPTTFLKAIGTHYTSDTPTNKKGFTSHTKSGDLHWAPGEVIEKHDDLTPLEQANVPEDIFDEKMGVTALGLTPVGFTPAREVGFEEGQVDRSFLFAPIPEA